MTDNAGEKSRNSTPVTEQDMRWSGPDNVPEIDDRSSGGPRSNRNRDISENTNESKGNPYTLPPATGRSHCGTEHSGGGTLEESY